MTTPTFQAAFDRLHREMRLVLREGDITFDGAVRDLARRRLVSAEEVRLLDTCRSLRNFLAHSNDLIAARLVRVEVEPALAPRLDAIAERLARRVPFRRFLVPWPKVRCGRLDEAVEPLMAEMLARDFSHVPVLAEGRVVAVFDERALFRALASDRLDAVTPQTRLRDIVEAGAFARAAPQEAGVIFVPRSASLADLRTRIAAAAPADARVSLLIVTETGDPGQRPVGLATIWDLPDQG